MSNIHIDLQFLPEYKDHKSAEYISLVQRLEEELLATIQKNDPHHVSSISITDVRPGSVVLDIDVVYRKQSTKAKAFSSIVHTIQKNPAGMFVVGRVPVMVREKEGGENTNVLLLSILVCLGVLIIIGSTVLALKLKNQCHKKNNSNKKDVVINAPKAHNNQCYDEKL